ncbi:MAG: hypothetical protein IT423_18020 [Pirellulaceae bacterium]|nr:hypothetical protein [Pirellulaceae bacterium]
MMIIFSVVYQKLACRPIVSLPPKGLNVLKWCVLIAILLGLYWPLLGGNVPAFRDTYHFYYPLQVWLDQQAQTGNYLPQYNPLDGTGINLVGETSTGLFYPGRILWWLPGLSVAQRMGLFLLLHNALAGAGAAYAAARAGQGSSARMLAALAYALSGPVLFQHTNPIYLIGAAWTPWALAESYTLMHSGSKSWQHGALPKTRWWLWILATSCMLLGGDAQATVNTGLITVLAIGWAGCRAGLQTKIRARVQTEDSSGTTVSKQPDRIAEGGYACYLCFQACVMQVAGPLARLMGAVLLVTGLTAAQWIPGQLWLSHSARQTSVHDSASVAESSLQNPADLPKLLRTQLETPLQSPPRQDTYAFSVAPWHGLTLVWATVGGHFLPEHSRVMAGWAAEPRMWTASLSVGLLTLCLAIANGLSRPLRSRSLFWWLVVLLAGTAMLGNYAPVGCLRNLLTWIGAHEWRDQLPADEVGGVYWLLTQIVPGYDAFRYPAKWSVWFALGLTLCAAQAIDQWPSRHSPVHRPARQHARLHVKRLCLWIGSIGLMSLLLWGILNFSVGMSVYVGQWWQQVRPDPWLGRINIAAVRWTIFSSLVLATFVSLATYGALRYLPGRHQPLWILCLVALELGCATRAWLVSTPPPVVHASPDGSNALPTRVWAHAGRASFEGIDDPSTDGDRVSRQVKYQQQFALGKLHLLQAGTGNLAALTSLTPRALANARRPLLESDTLQSENKDLDSALAWLGVSRRLVRDDQLRWQSIDDPRPICEWLPEPLAIEDAQPDRRRAQQNTLYVKKLSASQLRLEVECYRPGEIVVRLLQDGGWQSRLISLDNPRDVRTMKPESSHLGLFQTLAVPIGNWTIELDYEAPGLRAGASLSLFSLSLCLILASWLMWPYFSRPKTWR